MDEAARDPAPPVEALSMEALPEAPPPEASERSSQTEQRSPEELRHEIAETRSQLGNTVEALAEKADVKGQAQERISGAKDSARQKKDDFISRARQTTPESVQAGAQALATSAQQKPLPAASGGAFAGGMLVGWLLARRRAR